MIDSGCAGRQAARGGTYNGGLILLEPEIVHDSLLVGASKVDRDKHHLALQRLGDCQEGLKNLAVVC